MFPINPFQNPAAFFSEKKRDNNPFSSDMKTCEIAIKLKLGLKTYGNTIQMNPNFNIFISEEKLGLKKGDNPCSNDIIPKKEAQFSIINYQNNEDKGEETEIKFNESLCAPEPASDYSITDLTQRIDKMSLHDEHYEKIIIDEEKKDSEKIYTNNGSTLSDDNYF